MLQTTIRGLAAEIARVAFEEAITIDQPWTDMHGERHESFIGRPVSFHAMRGISAHSNGFQTARALHLLQVLIGAIDCPGGFRYEPPYPKPVEAHPTPHGRAEHFGSNKPLSGPHLGFPRGPEDLLIDADGNPNRIDKAFSWDAPLSIHGLMHMVISNAHAGDPYPVDVLFLYMANMAWNSSMNTAGVIRMLEDKDPATGEYRIPKIIYSDAYASEMVAYADLVLPDTTYLEQRDAVVPLEIGRVGQDEVGIGDHLRGIGVGIDDFRDAVFAGRRILVLQHLDDAGRVHRRVPGHVGHVEEQHVDRVRIAGMRVGDDHVHQAVDRQRRVPGKRLVDAGRPAVLVDQQIFGAARKAEMRARQRLVGAEMLGPAVRRRMRLDRLRIGRLVAEAAGAIDGADQHLQQMQRARRLEAVGMGRDAAHGMERHRPADEALMAVAVHVGPWLVDADRLVEGDAGDFGGKAADRLGGDAGLGGDGFRRIFRVEIFFGEKLERRHARTAVGELVAAGKRRPRALRADRHDAFGDASRRPAACRRHRARTARGPLSPGASMTSQGALE